MKNPIKSMSGNMWALLRRLRPEWKAAYIATGRALVSRGLAEEHGYGTGCFGLTDLGRMVCDAFTEGQESTR